MLIDRLGRVHNSLRISVTDRCNLRCTYCMPAETPDYVERSEILTFEEITRFARIAVELGVDDIRLTGGEPLVRAQLHKLVRALGELIGVRKISLTTNGILLCDQLNELFDAGLRSVNVSLDTLDKTAFQEITRRPGLEKVIEGIQAAQAVGMRVKINSIAQQGFTEGQIESLGLFARQTGIPIRFIEFMPLDADGRWDPANVLSGQRILQLLSKTVRPLVPVESNESSPSTEYAFDDGIGRIGVIPSVTKPFCGTCNRFRMTADGQLRSCLFGEDSGNVRELLRDDQSDPAIIDRLIADRIKSVVMAKKASHGTDDGTFLRPSRPMYSIGG